MRKSGVKEPVIGPTGSLQQLFLTDDAAAVPNLKVEPLLLAPFD